MIKNLFLILFITCNCAAFANDTLLLKVTSEWRKTYDNSQLRYMRKAVLKDSGWLALDYTLNNRLIHKGYYTDTTFEKQLYCHNYFDSAMGYRIGISCIDNYRINGISAYFNKNGDTLYRSTYTQEHLIESKDFRTGYITRYDTSVFVNPEIESEFPGGLQAWQNYIVNHIRYPREAYKNRIEGVVIVRFTVEKDGTVTDIRIAQAVDPLLDGEAIRLISHSPKWKPAIKGGIPVRSYKNQPIIFRL